MRKLEESRQRNLAEQQRLAEVDRQRVEEQERKRREEEQAELERQKTESRVVEEILVKTDSNSVKPVSKPISEERTRALP